MSTHCIGHGGDVLMRGQEMGKHTLCARCVKKGARLERGRGGRIDYVHPEGRREGAAQRARSLQQIMAPRNPRKEATA